MDWRQILLEAMKDKDQLQKMAALARENRHIEPPRYDYKIIQAEGRQPGEDDE